MGLVDLFRVGLWWWVVEAAAAAAATATAAAAHSGRFACWQELNKERG
jgi:hypothetical protein